LARQSDLIPEAASWSSTASASETDGGTHFAKPSLAISSTGTRNASLRSFRGLTHEARPREVGQPRALVERGVAAPARASRCSVARGRARLCAHADAGRDPRQDSPLAETALFRRARLRT